MLSSFGGACSSPTSAACQHALLTCTCTSSPLTPNLPLPQPNCLVCDRDGKCSQCAAGFTFVGSVCKPCTVNFCDACAPGKPGICTACGVGAYVGNGGRSCLPVSGGCMRNEGVVAHCAPACCPHVRSRPVHSRGQAHTSGWHALRPGRALLPKSTVGMNPPHCTRTTAPFLRTPAVRPRLLGVQGRPDVHQLQVPDAVRRAVQALRRPALRRLLRQCRCVPQLQMEHRRV